MTQMCFEESGSDPPVCGLHNVRLAKRHTSNEQTGPEIGSFSFLACPMSGQVVKGKSTRTLPHFVARTAAE
jgi:hypothetical protein